MSFSKLAARSVSTLAVLSAALFLSVKVTAQSWVHPGIVVSQAQLDATTAAYQAGNSVIVNQEIGRASCRERVWR